MDSTFHKEKIASNAYEADHRIRFGRSAGVRFEHCSDEVRSYWMTIAEDIYETISSLSVIRDWAPGSPENRFEHLMYALRNALPDADISGSSKYPELIYIKEIISLKAAAAGASEAKDKK